MERIIMIIMAAGALLGGLDRMLGNRLGLGEKFEEGFRLLGPVALAQAGIICIAPVLANVLGPAVSTVYHALGQDPGMFGSILAIDMGGYQLAKLLADDALTGGFAGIVAASMLGCTVSFTIPVGMGFLDTRPLPGECSMGWCRCPRPCWRGRCCAGLRRCRLCGCACRWRCCRCCWGWA